MVEYPVEGPVRSGDQQWEQVNLLQSSECLRQAAVPVLYLQAQMEYFVKETVEWIALAVATEVLLVAAVTDLALVDAVMDCEYTVEGPVVAAFAVGLIPVAAVVGMVEAMAVQLVDGAIEHFVAVVAMLVVVAVVVILVVELVAMLTAESFAVANMILRDPSAV